MDTVTYPDAAVAADLRASFVGLKIDLAARHPDLRTASRGQRVFFAPTLVVSEKDREARRWTGWLPPADFRADLLMARASAAMQRGDFGNAGAVLDQLLGSFAQSPAKPEALYVRGMAGFLGGNKDFAALKAAWETLAREHPESRFGIHARVIEDAH